MMPENNSENVVTEDEKKRKIQELRNLLQENDLTQFPHDEAYLERFLGGTDFDVAKAFDRIKTYYELLLECPEWFTKEAPTTKKELIEKEIRIVLPEKDKEGRPIYIVKLGNVDIDKMPLLDVIAVDDIWIESILLSNTSTQKGLCVILDIANFPWKQIKWLTPHNIKMGLKKLQSLPFKEYKFHVVNDAMMIHAAIKIIWPFLPQHIKEMVKFHFNDIQALHQFIDPEVLPLEYAGTNKEIRFEEIYNQLLTQSEKISESFKIYRVTEKNIIPK